MAAGAAAGAVVLRTADTAFVLLLSSVHVSQYTQKRRSESGGVMSGVLHVGHDVASIRHRCNKRCPRRCAATSRADICLRALAGDAIKLDGDCASAAAAPAAPPAAPAAPPAAPAAVSDNPVASLRAAVVGTGALTRVGACERVSATPSSLSSLTTVASHLEQYVSPLGPRNRTVCTRACV